MSLLTANNIPVARADISLPRIGRGIADVVLASPTGPAAGERVVLRWASGPLLAYTCIISAKYRGWWRMQLVAGAGRLNAKLPHRYYQNIPASTIAKDIISEAGEQAGHIDLPDMLPHYVRRAGAAYQQLAILLAGYDRAWRVASDGSIWIGVDAQTIIGPVAVSEACVASRKYVIALFPSLSPGDALKGIIDGQEMDLGIVDHVRHIVGPKLRTEVRCG